MDKQTKGTVILATIFVLTGIGISAISNYYLPLTEQQIYRGGLLLGLVIVLGSAYILRKKGYFK